MLRHFSSLPEVLEKELLTKGYSSEQIKESLNAPGSRFDTSFANSVDKLLVRLLESSSFIEDIGLNGNMMIHAVVSSNSQWSG
jgi:broad-specificity NMP kinase